MQLDLFQWDRIMVGKGYNSLGKFAFHEARLSFSTVIKAVPDHHDAARGLRDLEFWEEVFRETAGKDPESSVLFLWDKINEFSFAQSGAAQELKLNLLHHLLSLLADQPLFYHPPDLCRGCLFLQIGDFAAAEKHLLQLLTEHPQNGRLHGYLADALWMQGRLEPAWEAYVTALLLAPEEVAVEAIRNTSLVDLIEEHGQSLAPVYGFLKGLHSLIAPPATPTTREATAYGYLYLAEEARRHGNHQAMVAARKELKTLAPEILSEYLMGLG